MPLPTAISVATSTAQPTRTRCSVVRSQSCSGRLAMYSHQLVIASVKAPPGPVALSAVAIPVAAKL